MRRIAGEPDGMNDKVDKNKQKQRLKRICTEGVAKILIFLYRRPTENTNLTLV